MKFTRYKSHRTGKTLKSSFRTRRRSAARSTGGSSVDDVGDTGTACTEASLVMDSDIVLVGGNES
jgi:hypothetical protein